MCSSLAINEETQISEIAGSERELLDPILDSSFEGWYLRHAKRTLREIDIVYAAKSKDAYSGLSMIKQLDSKTGYVYYIAVLPEYRGKKIGSRLLDRSIERFLDDDIEVVLASLTQEHEEVKFLFKSRGFVETNFGGVAGRYGKLHALNLYRKMVVVTGEVVVYKDLIKKLESTN